MTHATETTLADVAYRHVKAGILSCGLLPGTLLRAPQLAESLEMSRTPVQEALKALTREGLLIAAPKVGYRVTPVTTSDIEEIFDLRLMLEVPAVGLAAKRAASRDVEFLRRQDERAKKNVDAGLPDDDAYLESVIRNNREFHVAIATMSGNQRLARLIGGLLDEGQRIYYLYYLASPGPGVDPHIAIIDALAARDPDAAREAMIAHLQDQAEGTLAEAGSVLA